MSSFEELMKEYLKDLSLISSRDFDVDDNEDEDEDDNCDFY